MSSDERQTQAEWPDAEPESSTTPVPPVVVPRWIQLVALPLMVAALYLIAKAAGIVLLAFIIAGAMVQSTLLAGNSGGIALAVDIEMGFTDRLLVAPIPRFAMVLGRLAGTREAARKLRHRFGAHLYLDEQPPAGGDRREDLIEQRHALVLG